MRSCAVACLVATIVCSGCAKDVSAPKIAALEKRIAELEEAQTTLKTEVDLHKIQIDSLNESVAQEVRPRSATFNPDDTLYRPIHTDFGVFLVSLANVKPYANGYQVTFNLGNPLAVDFDGAEIEVEWGPARPPEFSKEFPYSAWRKQFKNATKKLSARLLKSSWNPVEIVLAPASPTEIGQITITSIRTDKVMLYKKQAGS